MKTAYLKAFLPILSMVATQVVSEEKAIQREEYPMSTPIFTPPGELLLQMRASEVSVQEILSEETQSSIDRMFEVARGERADMEKRVMIGLAAPQIGIDKRIILVDIGVTSDRKNFGELMVFINPEIVWSSEEREEEREACYSVDSHVAGIVSRALAIKITAFDRQGNPVVAEFSGFTARIFQHEIDHLSGIRFPDRAGQEGVLHWIEADEWPTYRENWRTWDRKCPWDMWLLMKEGKPYSPPVKEQIL